MSTNYPITSKEIARFWRQVQKTDTCWLWRGSLNTAGYGQFHLHGKNRTSHRVSWILESGLIPDGLCVLHRCDVPACVRPEHLFLGTVADNSADMVAKGRSTKGRRGYGPKGSKNRNAKLNDDTVRRMRVLFSSGSLTIQQIADMIGVDRSNASRVVRGISWTHVEG